MAVYDLEEQERIAALKDWWEQWAVWVYAALAALVLSVAGVQGYRYYERSQADEAYALFKSVQTTAQEVAASKDFKKLSEAASTLATKYPRTFYATEAQLMAAKAAFDGNDLALAKTHLQWVAEKGRPTHVDIAKLRLAAVQMDEKKFDDAHKTLDSIKDEGFLSLAADMRGDVFAAQGRREDARAQYQIAVDKADKRSPMKALSQTKLDASGGAVEKPAEKSADKAGEKKADAEGKK